MSINIKSSLSNLKKESLKSILSNISVNFPYIKSDILKYTKESSSDFDTLLSLYNFDFNVISSSQVSASYLLAYLDFYALYTIAYANINIFENLQSAALNKYLYIFSLYREMFSLIKNKSIDKGNIQALYVNFLDPRNIDIKSSQLLSSTKNNNGILNYNNILTLPIVKTKEVTAKSIYISDNDKSIHSVANNTTLNNIDYTIARRQFNKISIADRIVPISKSVSYGLIPEVQGTVYGYIGEKLFIIVSDIKRDEDSNIISIGIKSSTNNSQWSDVYYINIDEDAALKIEDNGDTGLTIKFESGNGLAVLDSWKVTLRNIFVDDPQITARVVFGIMERISFIKCTDVSTTPLTINQLKKKNIKYDDSETLYGYYADELSVITPIHSKIDELIINATQKEPVLANLDGKLTYDFNFKINDIKAIINEYHQSGSIVFDKQVLEDIRTVKLNINSFLEEDKNMFIESNLIVYNELDKIEIPILNENQNQTILEYAVPYEVSESNIAMVKPRFPFNSSLEVTIKNIHTNEIIIVDTIDKSDGIIKIRDYGNNNSYILQYTILTSSPEDVPSRNGDILFGYYKDLNNKFNLAIRSSEKTKAFSGICSLSITMKSIEDPYISPIIYEISLTFN